MSRVLLHPDYFDCIDTEAQAYWLGFLTADGCVTDRGQIHLRLCEKDYNHVEAFRNAIGSEIIPRKVTINLKGKAYTSYAFGVGCRHMANSLNGYGVVPRKTGRTIAATVAKDLERHYWRGFVDGDGCLAVSKDKRWKNAKPRYSISLIADAKVAESFVKFCTERTRASGGSHSMAGMVNTRYYGEYGYEVASLLYENSTVFLQRKYEKFLEWQQFINTPYTRVHWEHSQETVDLKKF